MTNMKQVGWFVVGYDGNSGNHLIDERGWAIEILFSSKAPKIGCFDRHILWRRVTKVLKHLSPNKQTHLLNELRGYNERNN